MSNYAATVVKIDNIRKHSNADRLMCTNIFGNNVIVGLNVKEGDVGLYFPIEARIGKDFAVANDLIRRRDENGKPAGGMFDDNRRVRCQKFRGENSMGFWIPIDSLKKTFDHLAKSTPVVKIGDEFEELDGVEISKKYLIVHSRMPSQGGNGKKKEKEKVKSKLIENQFNFHFDTAQLGKNIHRIKPSDMVSVSLKMHGTSAIAAHVLCKRELSWWENLTKKFGANVNETEYDYLYSSRRVVKNDRVTKNHNHFYGHDLWTDAGNRFKGRMHKGETVYYEIVGYTPEGKFIQKGYDYGCSYGEYAIYIYRITHTNVDGRVIELPWDYVMHRALELGMQTCPTIYHGRAGNLFEDIAKDDAEWNTKFLERLKSEYVFDQDSEMCKNTVPEEGIVVRIEKPEVESFKLKAFRFLKHETDQLDTGEIDMESQEAA